MNDSTIPEIDTGEDYSLEIAIRLDNARAIADLVETVCGSSVDGSDSLVEELGSGTLRAAMHCIRQEIDAAEALIHRQTDFDGKLAVRQFAERAMEVIS